MGSIVLSLFGLRTPRVAFLISLKALLDVEDAAWVESRG